jgi:ribosome maturation factor RimP
MIQSEIEQILKPLIDDLGYELWGCEYLVQGKHSLLRIYIDKVNGINIEDCERVSKQVSALLDVEDPISRNYSLEISSPGISRPLFNKEQYRRYIGHDIQVKLFKPVAGRRKLSGTLMTISDNLLMLKVDDEQLEVQFSQIVKANLTGE